MVEQWGALMAGPQSAGSLSIRFPIRTSLGATLEQPASSSTLGRFLMPPPQNQPCLTRWAKGCHLSQVGGRQLLEKNQESPLEAWGVFLPSALPTSFQEKWAEGLVHLCHLEGDPTGMPKGRSPPEGASPA